MRTLFWGFVLCVQAPFIQTLAAQERNAIENAMFPAIESSQLSETLKGRVLVEEQNCVACHSTASVSLQTDSKKSPRLSGIGKRANPYYIERFIRSPHDVKPGTSMPNIMSHLDDNESVSAANEITHFLFSLSESPFELNVPDSVAAEKGRGLFHTVGCVACHSPRDDSGKELLATTSTPLGELKDKYNVKSLTEFLANPHQVRPSGRMPSLNLPRRDYERIAHYLLRETKVPGHLKYTMLKGRVWEGLEVNVEREKAGHVDDFDLAKLGRLQQNSAIIYEGFLNSKLPGTAKFFLEMNGGELWINEKKVVNLEPSSRRGVKKASGETELVAGWNKLKFIYIHAGKEPKLSFEMSGPIGKRSAVPSSILSISTEPIEPFIPYKIDSDKVEDGKRQFVDLGCVNCHDDVKNKISNELQLGIKKRASISKLSVSVVDGSNGCLSDQVGQWPQFALSASQKTLIKDAIPKLESSELGHQQIVNKSLITFNCLACHDRKELGGVPVDRNQFFVGNRTELGNEGRIPPPLTLVGAKLQKSWISEVMLRGQRQREYLATKMPQFGEANVGHLVDMFEKVDSIEPVAFEKIEDLEKVKQAGNMLIGTTGFSCIACHDFNGQKAAGPGALELIHTTSRVKKDWFYEFMLKPNRFRKGTIMPSSWPGGHVFMEDVLGGDAKKQIESLWVYLEDGQRAKNPIGLSRKSPELRVTDEAVICRGRGTAGYRGLAVGYPERVSIAFDTQEVNLRLLWKGEFTTVDNGRFFARGRDRVSFPQGIPFHRLKSLDDNWPYKRKTDYTFPQDQGYRFGGYTLDQLKRPTFFYEYGEVKVSDFFEDRLDDQKNAFFKRTMTFDVPESQEEFYFRAASGSIVNKTAEALYKIDRLVLSYKIENDAGKKTADRGVIRQGEPNELLIPLKLQKGKTILTLEYKW